MTKRSNATRGISLIEILIVVFIIGVLVALTLPAVQYSRAASRNISCSANLRQIGIACGNYLSSNGTFPAGTTAHSNMSMFVALLPYLDLVNLHNSINMSMQLYRNADLARISNETAFQATIGILICPDQRDTERNAGSTTYAGNGGYDAQSERFNGVFSDDNPRKIVSPASILDGMSQTALFTEWIVNPIGSQDRLATVFNTKDLRAADEYDSFVAACRSITFETSNFNNVKMAHWADGENGETIYTHDLSLNENTCLNYHSINYGAFTAGSRHAGTANMLACDGSVRSIKKSTSPALWRSLGSRDGGDIVDGF